MIPKEIAIQDKITKWLEENEIYASTVIFTFEIDGGLLSITTYSDLDYEDLINLIGYKTSCDKSGYILCEGRTILLKGIALANFLL